MQASNSMSQHELEIRDKHSHKIEVRPKLRKAVF